MESEQLEEGLDSTRNTADTKVDEVTPALSFTDAYRLIGGTSRTSKMPFHSWSISAEECKTGGKLQDVEGSTCHSCYALTGMYRFPNVKTALNRRLMALENPQFVDAFVIVLTHLYKSTRKTYMSEGIKIKENRFRWHDAGDVQSLKHLEQINEIALRTPFIIHWLPTREYAMVNEYLKSGKTFSANLLVRMSATMVGQEFKKRPMGLPYSLVGVDNGTVDVCPASKQGNKCLDCKNCWDFSKDVSYPLH